MSRAVAVATSLAAFIAVAACKTASPARPATSNAASPDGYLVWTQDETGAQRTRWLAADGTELGRADGVLIAHAGGVWRLDANHHAFKMQACEWNDRNWMNETDDVAGPGDDGGSGGSSTGSRTTIALVGPDGKARVELGTPTGAHGAAAVVEMGDQGELETSASLQASVGRFLFVEETVYSQTCDDRGGSAIAAHVVDLTTGAPRVLVTTAALSPTVREAAHAALVAPGCDEGSEELPTIGPAELGETLPAWRDGKLAIRHLLWIDASSSCASGFWSSRTSSTWLDGDQVPTALAAEPAIPAAIAARLAAATGPAGVSWGTVDDAWRTRFAATQR